MALLIVMVVYPVFFTVSVSFSNYGTGHLVTKQIAIDQIETRTYLPEDAIVYSWVAFQNAAGDYMLWLTDPDTGESFTVTPGEEPVQREGAMPDQMDGFSVIPDNGIFSHLSPLSNLIFGVGPDRAYRVSQQQLGIAAQYEQQYVYDSSLDAMIDQATGEIYYKR